jgi:O-acetylhomoserine (thiol)-lyase
MERHCENALKIAEYLQGHDAVESVRFPGLPNDPEYDRSQKYLKGKGGGMVVFELKGGSDAGKEFIEALKLFLHLANVGDAKSLAIHPATTTHSQLSEEQQLGAGITPGLIRLSVGIENSEDIIADLEQALASVS